MTVIHAGLTLTPEGWQKDVRLTVSGGRIEKVEPGLKAEHGDERHRVIVPAMPNLHSHAFQRAMAGLAEVRGPTSDSFWSWRTVMYKFGLSMTPDHVEAVAAGLYMEMLEAGFCRVGEFHYLHHDPDGRPYANIAEMAERIGAASAETGIGLTLLPVLYVNSGFGGKPPVEDQRRFINSTSRFETLMAACRDVTDRLDGAVLGVAPHSLRAVTPGDLTVAIALAGEGPIHIHVAEQTREVEDCIAWSGARPVQWLLDNADVDGRWCLIHATHMTEDETRRMAKSGAVAGLCPITEANLGDGIFPAPAFLDNGGRFGIGSDSNILISVAEELRQLEYSQRLGLRARNVVAEPGGSTGRSLFQRALAGGGAALHDRSELTAGASANFVSLDTAAVHYLNGDQTLDSWVFASGIGVDCVWSAGRKVVSGGVHVKRDAISKRFRAAMEDLISG